MYTQIPQVGLRHHLADGVGHCADAQLEAGAVGDLRHNQTGHRQIHLRGGSAAAKDIHRGILPLYDHIHIADMDTVVKSAKTHGHVLVDFHNNGLGTFADGLQVGTAGAKVKPAVLIHRRDLKHRHIQGLDTVGIVSRQLRIAQGDVKGEARADSLALNAAHMPGVPGEMAGGVGHIKNRRLVGQDAAPDLHIRQLLHPLRQGLVQRDGRTDAPPVVQPVAGFDHLDRLAGGGQLLLILVLIVHRCSSCIPVYITKRTKGRRGAAPLRFRTSPCSGQTSLEKLAVPDCHTFHKTALYHRIAVIATKMSKKSQFFKKRNGPKARPLYAAYSSVSRTPASSSGSPAGASRARMDREIFCFSSSMAVIFTSTV